MSLSLTPIVSANPYNSNVGWNNSWINVQNNQNRPLFAQAVYPIATNIENALQEILDQLRTVPNDDGFVFIDNTDVVEGTFQSIHVVSACKLADLIADNSTIGNLTNYELPQGYEIRGQFSKIQLQYGAVIAYKTLDSIQFTGGLVSTFDGKYLIDINLGAPIVPIGG